MGGRCADKAGLHRASLSRKRRLASAAVAWAFIGCELGCQLGCSSGLLVGRDQATGLRIEGASASPVAVMIGKATPLPPLAVRNVGSLALGDLRVSLAPGGGPITIANDACSGRDLSVNATCAVALTATATSTFLVTGTLVVSDGGGRSMATVAVSIAPAGLTAHLDPDQPLVVAPGCSSTGKIVVNNNGPEATDFDFTSSSPNLTVSLEKAGCAVGNIGAGSACALDLSSTATAAAPDPPWMVTIAGKAGGTAIVAVPLDVLPAISVSPTQLTVTTSPDGGVGTATLSVRTGSTGARVYDPAPVDMGAVGTALSVYGCNIGGVVQASFQGQNTTFGELIIAPCATCELTVLARGSGGKDYSRTVAFSDPNAPTTALAQVVVTVRD
jgi:hypothetical protein